MSRWHCAGEDTLLLVVTLFTTIWMVYEYSRYAIHQHRAIALVNNEKSVVIKHLQQLRSVFLQCGAIHAVNMVLAWWITPYLAIALFTGYNAYISRKMNQSKSMELSMQEQKVFRQKLDAAKEFAQNANNYTPDELRKMAHRLQKTLDSK